MRIYGLIKRAALDLGNLRATMFWANSLSIVRIPLGVLFLFVAHKFWVALAVIGLAALTDVLDGYVARRVLGPQTSVPHPGDWLDPVCDKIFVLFVLIALVKVHETPLVFMLLLLLREVLQVVAIGIYALIPARHHLPYNYRANRLGKLTTVFQFSIALIILFGQPTPWPLAIITATLGVTSLVTYVARFKALA